MPVSPSPTFQGGPPYFQLPVGTSGNVLTSNGAGKAPTFQPASGGGIGSYLLVALGAATVNDLNPGGGWPTGIGRLDLVPFAGGTNLTGLLGGSDAQMLLIGNLSATDTVTLASQNAGSSAANRFRYAGDVVVVPGETLLVCYYGGSVNRWVIA